MKPVEALRWIETNMVPFYPLGDYKVHPLVNEMKF